MEGGMFSLFSETDPFARGVKPAESCPLIDKILNGNSACVGVVRSSATATGAGTSCLSCVGDVAADAEVFASGDCSWIEAGGDGLSTGTVVCSTDGCVRLRVLWNGPSRPH